MRARVIGAGLRAANVEAAKFGQSQILDERPWRRQPLAIRAPANFRLKAKIMENHKLVIARELHVQLGGVIAARHRILKRKQRVLGPQPGATAMRDVEGCHGKHMFALIASSVTRCVDFRAGRMYPRLPSRAWGLRTTSEPIDEEHYHHRIAGAGWRRGRASRGPSS